MKNYTKTNKHTRTAKRFLLIRSEYIVNPWSAKYVETYTGDIFEEQYNVKGFHCKYTVHFMLNPIQRKWLHSVNPIERRITTLHGFYKQVFQSSIENRLKFLSNTPSNSYYLTYYTHDKH